MAIVKNEYQFYHYGKSSNIIYNVPKVNSLSEQGDQLMSCVLLLKLYEW